MPSADKPERTRKGQEQVYSITSASEGHSDELGAREIRYAISMAVRSVAFVAGVIVWQYAVWAGVFLLLLAIVLPYTSVILANAGVRRKGEGGDIMKPEPYGEISGGAAEEQARDGSPVGDPDPQRPA